MDQYELVRTGYRVYKKSIRQISRETGHSRKTIRKVLAGLEPQYRRKQEPACQVMDPVSGVVEGWLRGDLDRPKKQRHTAHRIWKRLVEEHAFGGAESTVRGWVRERKGRLGWPKVTAGHLSIKLCWMDNSSGLLKARLKHSIELRKSRSDAACNGSPSTVLQR